MTETTSNYNIGQHIHCSVESVLSYGVFVRLEDGKRGYIRRPNLSWPRDGDPHQLVEVGQNVEAVVVQLPTPTDSLQLSLKAAMPDLWDSQPAQMDLGWDFTLLAA